MVICVDLECTNIIPHREGFFFVFYGTQVLLAKFGTNRGSVNEFFADLIIAFRQAFHQMHNVSQALS